MPQNHQTDEWERYLQAQIASLRADADPENARREALTVLDNTYAELSVTTDEIDRQNAHLEDALRRAGRIERRYIALTSLTRDCVVETDEAGTIKEANHRIVRRLLIPEDRLLGKPLLLYIWDPDYQVYHDALRQVVQHSVEGWDIHLKPRGGVPIRYAMSATRLDADHANSAALLWVFRETSRHVRPQLTRSEMRQSQPEFRP